MKKSFWIAALAVISLCFISCKVSLLKDVGETGELTEKIRKNIEAGKYNLDETDESGFSYATKFIKQMSNEDFDYLDSHGMSFTKPDANGEYPIFVYLNQESPDKDMIIRIYEKHGLVSVCDKQGQYITFYTVIFKLGLIDKVLEWEIPLTLVNKEGKNVYDILIEADNPECFRYLLVNKKGWIELDDDTSKKICDYLKTKDKNLARAYSQMNEDVKRIKSNGDNIRPQERRPADREKDCKMKIICTISGSYSYNPEAGTKVYAMCDIKADNGTVIRAGSEVTIHNLVDDKFVVEDDFVCPVYKVTIQDESVGELEVTGRYLSRYVSEKEDEDGNKMYLFANCNRKWVSNYNDNIAFEDMKFCDYYDTGYIADLVLYKNYKVYKLECPNDEGVPKENVEFYRGFTSDNFVIFSENDPYPMGGIYALDNLTLTYIDYRYVANYNYLEFGIFDMEKGGDVDSTYSLVNVDTSDKKTVTNILVKMYPYQYILKPEKTTNEGYSLYDEGY